MQIEIIKERLGYSAHIAEMGIHTEGDDWNDLMDNINDAIEERNQCFN